MGKINYGRVVIGGLLAGVILSTGEYVLNDMLLAEQMAVAMANLGLAGPGAHQIAAFVIITFIFGIALVWLYAAIRPRFGAGVKTAIIAGVAAWLLYYCLPTAGYTVMGVLPRDLTLIACLWGLVEIVIASIAGAWVYKESD